MSQVRLGRYHSPETRARMSQTKIGNKYMLGHKHSPETRERISQALLGKYISPETRERISQARLGKKYALGCKRTPEFCEALRQWRLGKKHSPETIEKMRQARLRRTFPQKMTSIERLLQDEFERRRLKFEMHKPMFSRFQPDFVFEQAKLIVEADGDYWHSLPKRRIQDTAFNNLALAEGWSVWRFGEQEIRMHPVACARAVARFVRDHLVKKTPEVNKGAS